MLRLALPSLLLNTHRTGDRIRALLLEDSHISIMLLGAENSQESNRTMASPSLLSSKSQGVYIIGASNFHLGL